MVQSTLGERLQQARQQLGWSLADVSEKLNISKEILGGFEANDFSVKLPEIYTRGFFIAYVKLLNLNASAFLAEYETLTGTARRTGFPSLGHLQFESGEETVKDTEGVPETQSSSARRLKVSLRAAFRNRRLLYVIIACVMLLLLFGCRSRKKTLSVDTEATSSVVNEVEIIPALMEESRSHVTQSEPFMPSDVVNVPQKTVAPKTITLVASEVVRVFVRTEQDKKRVFSGTLEAGTRQSIPKEAALQVSFSEGNHLVIECSDGTSVRPQTAGRGWIRIP